MYAPGNWEFLYASALVSFANADERSCRPTGWALMEAFNPNTEFMDFTARELKDAHDKARRGVGIFRKWDELSTQRRAAWVKEVNASLPLAVPAQIHFIGVDVRKGLRFETRPTGINDMTNLRQVVDLGLALFSSDNSVWRKRLSHCHRPECGGLFINGMNKPKVTCSTIHKRELHNMQMRLKNGRRELAARKNSRTDEYYKRRKRELDILASQLEAAKVAS